VFGVTGSNVAAHCAAIGDWFYVRGTGNFARSKSGSSGLAHAFCNGGFHRVARFVTRA
jgi:hypothetical protein